MKLLIGLRNKPFCNDCHFFMIAVALLIFAFKYWFFWIFLSVFLIFIIKKTKLIIPIIILLLFILLSLWLVNIPKLKSKEIYTCKIVEVEDTGYVGWVDGCKIKIIDKGHKYLPGDIIECKLEIQGIEAKSYETDFDYAEYLKTKRIRYLAKALSSKFLKSGFSISKIKYKTLQYYEKCLSSSSYDYVCAMVFAENDLEENLKEGYSVLGISHILAISGLHIMLLYKIIAFFLLKIFHYYKDTIPLLVLGVYTILIGCPAPCVRALLCLGLSRLNRKGIIQYTKLDILSICFIMVLLINPYQLFNSSFKLSYLVSFILIFMSEFFQTDSKLKGMYYSFFIIYFVTFPMVINFTNFISLYSLLFSPILSMLVTLFLLPIIYLLTIFPFLDLIFKYVFLLVNEIVLGLNQNAIGLHMMSFNIFTMLIYYFLYILVLVSLIQKRNRIKYILTFLLYIIILLSIKTINPIHKVTFIDVGQGDCALIELGNNQGNMVIDAYNCIDYLKSTGLSKIDYLVLTHSDRDHIEDAKEIIKQFNVKHVLFSGYDEGFLEYNGRKVFYDSSFKLGNIEINVLGPIQEHINTNSNSVVLRFTINSFSFLFCGDMTIEEEQDLIQFYGKQLKSSVLKVGHHGSSTSSSMDFIRLVQPKYSVISVGAYNSYGLPDKEVLSRLEMCSTVYQTKESGNITFNFFKNRMWITTYR